MNKVIELVAFVQANLGVILSGVGIILGGLMSVFTGIIALMMLIPGAAPQKQLQGIVDFIQRVVDFIAKFSIPKS